MQTTTFEIWNASAKLGHYLNSDIIYERLYEDFSDRTIEDFMRILSEHNGFYFWIPGYPETTFHVYWIEDDTYLVRKVWSN